MNLKQNVGIDHSMDSFEANLSVLDNNFEKKCLGKRSFSNDTKGFTQLIEWVGKKRDTSLEESYTMEFTGVYHEQLAYFLKGEGKTIHMVIPSKSRKYSESLEISSKTDRIDARNLGWMGLERRLKEWNPISRHFLLLRTLTREREELLKERTMVNNRLHAAGKSVERPAGTMERYRERIELINRQIGQIEKELKRVVEEDEALDARIRKIITIPGVAFTTAITVVAETGGFAAITGRKQLASYAGYDVRQRESGQYKGRTKISKQGNAHLRRIMHFPAQSAIIHNNQMSEFHERVDAKKNKPMIAGVAVQRKLLCLIYTLWKNDTVYDPHYEHNRHCDNIKKVREA